MFNPKMFLSLFLLVFLLAFPSLFAQETITITTYYPSPYGSYGYLHTDKFGVGDNDGSGGPTEADIPITSGNVWIAGNVGIGTTAPGTKLHVFQDQTTIADNTALVTLESGGTATVNKGRVLDVYTTRGDGFSDGYIAQFRNLVSTKMYIRGDGNVGIGTTGPLSNLHVVTASNGYDGTMRVGGNSTTLGLLLEYDQDAATVGTIYSNPTYDNTSALLKIGVDGDANPNQLVLKGDGNVGIGTTGPAGKLQIGSLFSGSNGSLNGASNPTRLIVNGTSGSEPALTLGYYSSGYGMDVWVSAAGSAPWPTYFDNRNANSPFRFRNNTAGTPVDLMIIDSNGNVGIGTAGPGARLDIKDDSNWSSGWNNSLRVQSINYPNIRLYTSVVNKTSGIGNNGDGGLWFFINGVGDAYGSYGMVILPGGNVGIATTTPGYTLTVNGTAWCTSGAWTGSDLRWKENVETLPNPLEKVLKLRGVSFDWKRAEFKGNNFPEGRQIGLIAQEMEKEFPELVTTDAQGYKAIAYDRFTAVLLEAIKQLKSQNDALKARIEALEKKL